MAKKDEKQHFLPQFYMRYFSNTKSLKSVSTYTFKANKYCEFTTIKELAQQYNFYKNDKLDDVIEGIEGRTAPVLKNIITQKTLPHVDSDDYVKIINYILLQMKRTAKSIKQDNKSLDALIKVEALKGKHTEKELNDSVIKFKDSAPTQSIGLIKDKNVILLDLSMTLLHTQHDEKFVTSDNPELVYNQYFQDNLCNLISFTRLGNRGLIIAFPLSPDVLILFHDSKIYSMKAKPAQRFVNISRSDVRKLNLLQACNADNHIIFCGSNMKDAAVEIVNTVSMDRSRIDQHNYCLLESPHFANTNKLPLGSSLAVSYPPLMHGIDFDFLKVSKSNVANQLNGATDLQREGIYVELYDQFHKYKFSTNNTHMFFDDWYFTVYRPKHGPSNAIVL